MGAEQLTEREGVLYARARQEAIADLVAELDRLRFAEEERHAEASGSDYAVDNFVAGYDRAQELIAGIGERLARIAPVGELPEPDPPTG